MRCQRQRHVLSATQTIQTTTHTYSQYRGEHAASNVRLPPRTSLRQSQSQTGALTLARAAHGLAAAIPPSVCGTETRFSHTVCVYVNNNN